MSFKTRKIYSGPGGAGSGGGTGGGVATTDFKTDQNNNFTGAAFGLSFAPGYVFGVFKNGVEQVDGVDYNIVGLNVVFVIPCANDYIVAKYLKA